MKAEPLVLWTIFAGVTTLALTAATYASLDRIARRIETETILIDSIGTKIEVLDSMLESLPLEGAK